MQTVRYESKNERNITESIDFMRSKFPIPVAEHKIIQNEDGTRKAHVSIVEELAKPDTSNIVHVAFLNGFGTMLNRLNSPDFVYSEQAVLEVGRLSALHACQISGLSTEGLGLDG